MSSYARTSTRIEMLRDRFVNLSILAFGLIIGGFVIRGFARTTLGGQTGDLLAAPIIGLGFVLIVILTAVSILGFLGVGPLADVDNG